MQEKYVFWDYFFVDLCICEKKCIFAAESLLWIAMSVRNSNTINILVVLLLITVVILSSLVTTHLVDQFEQEEQKKIELWAEATRQFILADADDNIDLLLQVMEGNTTIPVYMVDTNYNLLLSRNVAEPKRNVDAFYVSKIDMLRATQEPIEVRVSDNVLQYIYYEDSTVLKWLSYFPYIQLVVMLALAAMAAIALIMAQRSEKNILWVGLSKETAHQLGTPISSLNAWLELLKTQYPNDTFIPQMDEDIRRLQMITERFSKIGSQPNLDKQPILPIIQSAMEYMRVRTSNKITYTLQADTDTQVLVCKPLFEWVIENLCKNAIDSMEGKGEITLSLLLQDNKVHVDITDTGKGIDRRHFKTIFRPGYTSKKRGWGLGLSLAKRIVEDYHLGKLFVKQSQIGVGTTFRIILEKAKDS